MDWRENKLEIGIVIGGFIAVVAMTKMFSSFGSSKTSDGPEISYEMPRPKSDVIGDFGLDGRELEHRLVNPFKNKKSGTESVVAPPVPKPGGSNVAQNKVRRGKKKKEEAKAEEKKPEHSLTVVEATPGSKVNPGLEGGARQVVLNRFSRPAAPPAQQQTIEGERLSPDQWRALLTADPSPANMVRLLQALSRQEVDQGTFFSIVEDLSRSQNPQTQKVAIYGVTSYPSLRSFALLTQWETEMDSSHREQIQQGLMAYTQTARLGILNQALQQNELSVSMRAAQLVLAGIQAAKSPTGPTPQDPRTLRGDVKTSSLEDFQRLVPTFQRWVLSGNAGLTGIAQQILLAMGVQPAVTAAGLPDTGF